MAAYVIADNAVTDCETYEAYRKDVPATLEPFGGRFLVRGGAHRTMEGAWRPSRLVVLEFPDAAARDGWYASDAYQRIIGLRQTASVSNIVFVDGA